MLLRQDGSCHSFYMVSHSHSYNRQVGYSIKTVYHCENTSNCSKITLASMIRKHCSLMMKEVQYAKYLMCRLAMFFICFLLYFIHLSVSFKICTSCKICKMSYFIKDVFLLCSQKLHVFHTQHSDTFYHKPLCKVTYK